MRIGLLHLSRKRHLRLSLFVKPAGLEKASGLAGREEAGSITWNQVEEIAETKMPDLNAIDIEGAKQQVAGTARSMGIAVN